MKKMILTSAIFIILFFGSNLFIARADLMDNPPNFYYDNDKKMPLEAIEGKYMIAIAPDQNPMGILDNQKSDLQTATFFAHSEQNYEIYEINVKETNSSLFNSLKGQQGIQFISRVYKNDKSDSNVFFANRAIAKIKPQITRKTFEKSAADVGLCPLRLSSWDTSAWIMQTCNGAVDLIAAANKLFETGLVEYSMPNFVHVFPLSDDQKRIEDFHQPELSNDHLQKIKAPEAWDIVSGNLEYTPTIAVIDTGVDWDHQELSENVIHSGYDAVPDTIDGGDTQGRPQFCPNGKGDYHGTGVAGIIASKGIVTKGAAGDYVRILPIKVSYLTCTANGYNRILEDEYIANGVEWAELHMVDIVNLSLGSEWLQALPQTNTIIRVIKSHNKSIVFVAASGNNNSSNVVTPANMEEVIAVGAIGSSDKRWSSVPCSRSQLVCGSNYGMSLDIVAPGIKLSTTNLENKYFENNFNGTSGAAPIISAVAGLMQAVNPELTSEQIQDILQRTAVELPGYSFNQRTAEGGWNKEVGFGLVDAKASVEAALKTKAPRLTYKIKLDHIPLDQQTSKIALVIFDMGFNPSGTRSIRFWGFGPDTNSNGVSTAEKYLYGMTTGDYMVCLKPKHFLWRCLPASFTNNSVTHIDFSENGNYAFVTGEFNSMGEDGVVNAIDIEEYRKLFWDCRPNPTTGNCPEVDLDRNGVINSLDWIYSAWSINKYSSSWFEYIKFLDWKPFGSPSDIQLSNPPSNREALETVSVSLYSNQGTPSVGDGRYEVKVAVDLSALSIGAGAANLVIHYDPGVWDVVDDNPDISGTQVTVSTAVFPSGVSSVDTTRGEILLSNWNGSSSTEGTKSSGLLATIGFIPTHSIYNTKIWAEWRTDASTDSNVAEFKTGTDLVTSDIPDFETGVNGSPSRPLPQVSIFLPENSNTINTNMTEILVDVNDPYNQVTWVDGYIWYDNNWHYIGSDWLADDGWSIEWDSSFVADQIVSIWVIASIPGGDYGDSEKDNIYLDQTEPELVNFDISPLQTDMPDYAVISAEAQDNLSGVKNISVYYNSATDGSTNGDWIYIDTITGSSGSCLWYIADFYTAQHQIVFVVEDNAGNMGGGPSQDTPAVYGISHIFMPLLTSE